MAFTDWLTRFPAWLEAFDKLQIPEWSVIAIMSLAVTGLLFAGREFLSWFLKTNTIIDEVVRLETQIRDLQSDLQVLEESVKRLESTSGSTPHPTTPTSIAEASPPERPQFPLSH